MSQPASPIHIACAADGDYLPHCAAMLHSVLARHPGAQVHFLHGPDLPANRLAPLAGMVEAHGGFHAHCIPADWIEGLPRIRLVPPLMWYRVFLPELLPDQDRVLYLDADTLVVDDLAPLWRIDLGTDYVAAVSNVLDPEASDWPVTLGLDRTEDYFNSGVLLLNLEAMRADGMSAKLAAFGRDPDRALQWPDQDAFNALLWRRRHVLHPRWNCQNSLFYWRTSRQVFTRDQIAQATSEPAILHFEGGHLAKPWHYLSRHPFRHLYFQHRRQTPWPQVELEGRRTLFKLLRPLPTPWTINLLKAFYGLRSRLRTMLG